MKIEVDKGHGIGQDRGAVGFIAEEEIINVVGDKVIAKLRSLGHQVNEARPTNTYSVRDSLNARCTSANNWGADFFVSIHANAGGGTGTEVYTNNADKLPEAQRFLQVMLQEGITIHSSNRTDINSGIKDGSDLAVINGTSMSAMLVEICFVDTQSDVDFYRSHIEHIADAIVYGVVGVDLRNKTVAQPVQPQPQIPQASVRYKAHVQNLDWQGWVSDWNVAGTTGKGLSLQALVADINGINADIEIEGHVATRGWQSFREEGEVVGTIGENLGIEALRIKLVGVDADKYDVEYQVHVADIGWMNPVKNGDVAGTTGKGLSIQAVKIRLIKK